MNALATVLASEPVVPIDLVGWGSLVLALAVTIAWMAHLYR